MNCQDYEILINKELDGSLSNRELAALRAHLEVCPDCAQLAEEYRLLDRLLLESINQVEVPAGFREGVMAALPKPPVEAQPAIPAQRREKNRRPVWRWVSVGVAAAAVVLGFTVGGWFDRNLPEDPATDPPIIAEQDPAPVTPVTPPPADDPEPDPPGSGDQHKDPLDTETDSAENQTQPQEETNPPQEQTPESDPEEQPDVTYNSEFPLPQVTFGNTNHGEYTLLILASVVGYDATLPRVSGSTVTFYIETEEAYLEYQVDINGAEPVFLGETESLPSAASTAGYSVNSGFDYPCVEATSINGLIARNCGGDHQGLWLVSNDEETQVSENGGGSIVSWAGDGNKVLFTDSNGNLHLYYVAENISLTLSSSAVHSLCWSENGKAVVFSAYDSSTGYYSIFKVSVP